MIFSLVFKYFKKLDWRNTKILILKNFNKLIIIFISFPSQDEIPRNGKSYIINFHYFSIPSIFLRVNKPEENKEKAQNAVVVDLRKTHLFHKKNIYRIIYHILKLLDDVYEKSYITIETIVDYIFENIYYEWEEI